MNPTTLTVAVAAALGAAALAAPAAAQLLSLPTAPPAGAGSPVQEGAVIQLGQTQSGNLGVKAEGGQQLPLTAVLSPDRQAPKSGLEVYARVAKGENGLPSGVDVRLSGRDQNGAQSGYQGVQVGNTGYGSAPQLLGAGGN